jgi:hypothetical protein
MSHTIDFEPSYYDAFSQLVWRYVMMEEYQSIMKNDVRDIVLRYEGKSLVTSKWTYKVKHTTDGRIEKHKMRFVARGFSQVEATYYDDTFAHFYRYTSIRMIISLAAYMGWRLHQMDVKITFLNGEIEEEVCIEKPDGFMIHEKEYHVCRLKKAQCGLKQEPQDWYARIDAHLMILGFNKSVFDLNLYYNIVTSESLILVLYVDDLFLTGTKSLIVECKYLFPFEFYMKNLGMMHYFLGL